MGTLFNQLPRKGCHVEKEDISNAANKLIDVSNETELTLDQVIKIYEILVIDRKNNLMWHQGDTLDEQLAGFGEILNNIEQHIKSYVESNQEEESD